MSVEWILERIGFPDTEPVKINKEFFHCGRQKESDLVCLSLLVSREHCTFTKVPSGLYVTDTKSSNGVYVNGQTIKPLKQIAIKDGDIIGIGCCEIKNLDQNMFVYKLKSEMTLPTKCENDTASGSMPESARLARKELSKSRKSDEIQSPAKVAKISPFDRKAQPEVNCIDDDDDDIVFIEICSASTAPKEQNKNDAKGLKADEVVVNSHSRKVVSSPRSPEVKIENPQRIQTYQASDKCSIIPHVDSQNIQKCTSKPKSSSPVIIDVTDEIPQNIQKSVCESKSSRIHSGSASGDNETKCNLKSDLPKDDQNGFTAPVVKQECESFTEYDIIDINDQHENLRSSQLFDKTSIKEEAEDNDEDSFIGSESYSLQKVKTEPEPEFIDVGNVPESAYCPGVEPTNAVSDTDIPPVEEAQPYIDPDLLNPSSVSHPETSKDQPSSKSLKDVAAKLSKSKDSSSDKGKRRGPEIIEPHHIKPKRSGKSDDEKRSPSKGKKHKKEKRRHSSSSAKKGHYSKSSSSKGTVHKHSTSTSNDSKSKNDSNSLSNDESKRDKDESSSTLNASSLEAALGRPRCKTTIVKAKVSSKSRGDVLCADMQSTLLKPKPVLKKTTSTSSKVLPPMLAPLVLPRRQVRSSAIPYEPTSRADQPILPPLANNTSAPIPSSPTNGTANGIHISPYSSDDEDTPQPANEEPSTSPPHGRSPSPSTNERPPSPPKNLVTDKNDVPSNEASSAKLPSADERITNISTKKVKFNNNLTAVREFPIQDGHKLRNIKEGFSTKTKFQRETSMKQEDFLARVFIWEPVWLEQQMNIQNPPPVVKKEDMQVFPDTFNTFEEYYKKMEVLLLLETWAQFTKEFENNGTRYKTSVALPAQILRNSLQPMSTPNGSRFTKMTIQTLVSKNHVRLQSLPVLGDMVILEYSVKFETSTKTRRAFAYVQSAQQQNPTRFLSTNEKISKCVPRPDFLMTYTVFTRVIDEHTLLFDVIGRFRSIHYTKPHLRLVNALQYVPMSPLRDHILHVNIDELQLGEIPLDQVHKFTPVTNEKLNQRQIEAVMKFTNSALDSTPKISLLVGPPGTGKSKVIANLVIEILYGEGRFTKNPPRILIAAPSNAAIDEIVLRLLEIRGSISDREQRFKMVRMGRIESMHDEVKNISVSELARKHAQKSLAEHKHKKSNSIELLKHRLVTDIRALESLVQSQPNNRNYVRDLEALREKYKALTNKRPEDEEAEIVKIQNGAKKTILINANVIACTLSSCYAGQMEELFGPSSRNKIATCIVDEATQSVEAEALIPALLGVRNLILVGDPRQLPATVMSTDAKKLGFDRSLFTRTKEALQKQVQDKDGYRDPIIMLNEQYRMISAISHWPNKFFYDGKLIDRVNYKQTFPFEPYRILNIDGAQDDVKFSNTSEAVFVGNLIQCMVTNAKMNNWKKKIQIGVITPYQDQKSVVLSTVKEQVDRLPSNIKDKFVIEVNTIDSFQGQERDVIIMSCVRSRGIGFLSDPQRLCVALTRAKFSLIICGNLGTFQRDNTWGPLLHDARSRGLVVNLNVNARPNDIKPHVLRLDNDL
ncbi:hypothetical protein QAD02_015041 [Eretmocerus hayati]|uniref:Uncharacterized protein n=1 Tax=Eretmocerus hayati TaxID=131215 RepID=A0ACC2P6N8_9HYME|nr:hypothetical protein QAD02_015041 [Eretmocerus hayati]